MDESLDYQLRANALNEAVKAHSKGDTLSTEEVVARATAYYEFLKGSK